MAHKQASQTPSATSIDRRQFMAGAAAASLTIASPKFARAADAGARIKLGMIGCGGRGGWIANLFAANGNYQIVAAADYFQDRVDGVGDKFSIPAKNRYTGLSGYKRLLEQDLDAVAIISPPYFHPVQAADAVDAGKHVYLAKPIAVDVPGCLSIEESGKKAAAKKQCFLVDFQTRANAFFIEAIRRVHNGDLGKLCFGESSYLTGRLGVQAPPESSPEARLRNWVFDKALSGDIITEQNIHTLDVMSWIMDTAPISACGTGGRKSRTDVGDCWDHFSLSFVYPDNVGITFCSKQYKEFGSQGGIRNRMFGTDGTLETEYGGNVLIRADGDKFYRGGATSSIYQEGAVNNIAAFHKSITEGDCGNATVPPSVRSNLITILGRTAAYTGRKVYWDKIIRSTDRIEGRLDGLKS
jgi:predicted dehydrogenase